MNKPKKRENYYVAPLINIAEAPIQNVLLKRNKKVDIKRSKIIWYQKVCTVHYGKNY